MEDKEGMDNMILKFKIFYEYGEDFNAEYFGEMDRDEIEFSKEDNGIVNEPNDLMEEYYRHIL